VWWRGAASTRRDVAFHRKTLGEECAERGRDDRPGRPDWAWGFEAPLLPHVFEEDDEGVVVAGRGLGAMESG